MGRAKETQFSKNKADSENLLPFLSVFVRRTPFHRYGFAPILRRSKLQACRTLRFQVSIQAQLIKAERRVQVNSVDHRRRPQKVNYSERSRLAGRLYQIEFEELCACAEITSIRPSPFMSAETIAIELD